jgi:hypothetical protein
MFGGRIDSSSARVQKCPTSHSHDVFRNFADRRIH